MSPKPNISFIIPAFNEEKLLAKTLASIHTSMKFVERSYEIIVVDNNSTDRTSQIAIEEGAKVVFEAHNQIARARNKGGEFAVNPYLIFVDADTTVSWELVNETVNNLDSGSCCGGGAMMEFDIPVHFFYQTVLNLFHRLAGIFKLAAGCYVYCLRESFNAIGGFNLKYYAGEEIRFSRDLSKWGKSRGLNFQFIQSTRVKTSTRKFGSMPKVIFALGMHLLLPFAVFSRRLCWFWYKRKD